MPIQVSGEELERLLGLLRGSNSVEIKLTIPESSRYATLDTLKVDPLEARIRQVFFFDTPELTLNKAGIVVRARRIQDAAADTTVKLRPVVPDELPKSLRKDPAFTIEVDAMPGGFVCSGSLKGVSTNDHVGASTAVKTKAKVRKLFTSEQRALYREHAPDGLGLDDLSVLGPINVLKLKTIPKAFGRKVAVELWNYPDGSRILELSTKCLPGEAFQVVAETKVFLHDHGVDLSGEQQTKTRTALEFFAGAAKQASPEPVPSG
jgi:hypothetical protein